MSNTMPNRKAFTRTLTELAQKDPSIFVVTSDARGSVTLDEFAQLLPNQFVEVGIAEQNEVGIAAGMASFGKKVFVCAPACFLSTRSLEQVKVDVIYSGNPVRVIGISGGVSYGALGFSHQSLHDFAVMRTFPNMVVIAPCDRFQTEAVTRWLVKHDVPAYVRMGRSPVPDIYTTADESFRFGKANLVRPGCDGTIIATGEMVAHAVDASRLLAGQGLQIRVLDMHTIKPIDREAILLAAQETGAILTLEEHSIFGGLGAAIAEITGQEFPVPLAIVGVADEIPVEGSANDVLNHYGMTGPSVAQRMMQLLQKRHS
ncbi:MAG: transketolase C-terminal domain-containing protein [Sphaerochaeta sp.]|nr:transketolase C-terminal domain-containing protein [Sphaerochaeta sp.]